LKSDLDAHFGDKVEVTGEGTPETTGFFEVVIVSSGKVIHSKKNGQGHVDSSDKKKAIIDAIEEALKAAA